MSWEKVHLESASRLQRQVAGGEGRWRGAWGVRCACLINRSLCSGTDRNHTLASLTQGGGTPPKMSAVSGYRLPPPEITAPSAQTGDDERIFVWSPYTSGERKNTLAWVDINCRVVCPMIVCS